MSTARQITSLPRSGAVSRYDQFAIWQSGRTRICDVNDLLAFLQIGLRGPKGDKGDKGDPGSTVIVTPGGEVDAAALIFPTQPLTANDGKAANTNYVRKWLGLEQGIEWIPDEKRIRIQKTHTTDRTGVQPIFDIRCTTSAGGLPDEGAVGQGFYVESVVDSATKYGHFTSVAYVKNYATLNQNTDRFYGSTAFCPYADQNVVNGAPVWAIAAQVAENHKQSNPPNPNFVIEAAYFAKGTDSNYSRNMILMPAHGLDSTLTEIGYGIRFTTDFAKVRRAISWEGQYEDLLYTNEVNARRLVFTTGDFSGPIIDLHSARSAGNGCAIAINQTQNIQFQNPGSGVVQMVIGYDSDKLLLSGMNRDGNNIIVNVNGVIGRIPFNPI